MWKQLFAAVAAVATLGFSTLAASAQNPANTDPDFPMAPKGPPPAAAKEAPKPLSSLEAEGFRGTIFSPLPPAPRQPVNPGGGQPIPNATSQPEFDPMAAMDAGEFMWGPSPRSHPGCEGAWVWGSAELLLGNTSGVNVPPLVTTGPASAGVLAGAVGAPGTTILFGGQKMLDNWRTGLRLEGGAWLGPTHTWGVSGRAYSLFSTSDQLNGEGNGTNVVNLPQIMTVGGIPTQVPVFVGFPGITVGTVATTVQTTFAGGDLNLRRLLVSNEDFRFELFAGYRQMHLGDELGAAFRASGGLGAVILLAGDDSVRTRNNFYGGQVGSLGSVAFGRLTLQGQSAFAIGVNASDLDFSRTRVATIGTTAVPLITTTDGGRINFFSVAAEGGVRLGFRVTDHAKLTVGYTGIYWSKVRRAQEQFDLSDTPTGGITHFYANLVSLGGEVRY